MRIPITMSHGIRPDHEKYPLTVEHFDALMKTAADLGFTSIDYDDLDDWMHRNGALPDRPIMFDFDHPVAGILGCQQVMDNYGFHGTLFINTGVMNPDYAGPGKDPNGPLSWDQLRALRDHGWHIGSHTVTHPNLSKLSLEDPTGEKIAKELDDCDAAIKAELDLQPREFAYTGTSFSSIARKEVEKRYRFARLWITQSMYEVDGEKVRYADFLGIEGDDEPDGGPPNAARYIYKDSDPYTLPSMEFQALIYEPSAFRNYLEGALSA